MYYECAVEALPTPPSNLQIPISSHPLKDGNGTKRYNAGNWAEQKRREKGRKLLLSGQWRKNLMTTFVYAMQAYEATLMNTHPNHYSSCNYHCIIPHINKYKLF
jgi:hypothetical protein